MKILDNVTIDSGQNDVSGLTLARMNSTTAPTPGAAVAGVTSTGKVVVTENKISSSLIGEPTGAMEVKNLVAIRESDYNAGTPVSTTFYLVMAG